MKINNYEATKKTSLLFSFASMLNDNLGVIDTEKINGDAISNELRFHIGEEMNGSRLTLLTAKENILTFLFRDMGKFAPIPEVGSEDWRLSPIYLNYSGSEYVPAKNSFSNFTAEEKRYFNYAIDVFVDYFKEIADEYAAGDDWKLASKHFDDVRDNLGSIFFQVRD